MSDPEQTEANDEPFDLEREPLDPPQAFAIDWGGDGADPTRPARAHVLEALRPAAGPYRPPLDALLTLGAVGAEELERRRAELGIGQEHVPELLRMVRDRALNTADSDTPEVQAPAHALGILAGLDLSAAAAELVPLFDVDFDQLGEELPSVLGRAGAPALAPLKAYIGDHSRWVWGRSRAADALKELAEQHPELRAEAVAILGELLAAAETDHEDALTGALGALIDLQAVEALPLIRRAFELGKIDEMAHGPWGDVLGELGLEPEPGDPLVEESRRRFDERHSRMFPANLRQNLGAPQASPRGERAQAQKRKQGQARKAKNKRKASSASRKANRKKRK